MCGQPIITQYLDADDYAILLLDFLFLIYRFSSLHDNLELFWPLVFMFLQLNDTLGVFQFYITFFCVMKLSYVYMNSTECINSTKSVIFLNQCCASKRWYHVTCYFDVKQWSVFTLNSSNEPQLVIVPSQVKIKSSCNS